MGARGDRGKRMRGLYEFRRRHFNALLEGRTENSEQKGYEFLTPEFRRYRRASLNAKREALQRFKDEGGISDGVLRHIERDLDLEEARLEIVSSE